MILAPIELISNSVIVTRSRSIRSFLSLCSPRSPAGATAVFCGGDLLPGSLSLVRICLGSNVVPDVTIIFRVRGADPGLAGSHVAAVDRGVLAGSLAPPHTHMPETFNDMGSGEGGTDMVVLIRRVDRLGGRYPATAWPPSARALLSASSSVTVLPSHASRPMVSSVRTCCWVYALAEALALLGFVAPFVFGVGLPITWLLAAEEGGSNVLRIPLFEFFIGLVKVLHRLRAGQSSPCH